MPVGQVTCRCSMLRPSAVMQPCTFLRKTPRPKKREGVRKKKAVHRDGRRHIREKSTALLARLKVCHCMRIMGRRKCSTFLPCGSKRNGNAALHDSVATHDRHQSRTQPPPAIPTAQPDLATHCLTIPTEEPVRKVRPWESPCATFTSRSSNPNPQYATSVSLHRISRVHDHLRNPSRGRKAPTRIALSFPQHET